MDGDTLRAAEDTRERSLPGGIAAGPALVLGAALAGVGLLAAGCGGSRGPSVASLGTTSPAGGVSTARAASTTPRPGTAALAACFASHGFPASVGSGGAGRQITFGGVTFDESVDPGSPQFQAAVQACRKFLPGGGPPALTPAQRAIAARAMLRFAACMRRQGVPDFPDPNGEGTFPPRSIMKRIDPSSPLVQSAYEACKSLEPKIGPRLAF